MVDATNVYVRMILGWYEEPNGGEACLGQLFVQPVAFPMAVEAGENGGQDEILENEWALHRWAEKRFEEYEIWDMPVPRDAFTDGNGDEVVKRPDIEGRWSDR